MKSDETSAERSAHQWEVGWDGHERAQAQRLAKLSFTEKLEWLEEAHRLVLQMARSAEPNTKPIDEVR